MKLPGLMQIIINKQAKKGDFFMKNIIVLIFFILMLLIIQPDNALAMIEFNFGTDMQLDSAAKRPGILMGIISRGSL